MSNYNKYSGEKCVQKTAKAERRIIMKKKFFAIATIALLSIMCLSVFAACTTDVDGKTFVYDSYEIELNEIVKETADEMGMDLDEFTDYLMRGAEEAYSSVEITFEDGKVTMSGAGMGMGVPIDYEQDGSKIMNGEQLLFTVSGSKLIMEYAGTYKVIFKQK